MNCPVCKRGGWVIKYGGYKSRGVYRHRYKCKKCGKTFVRDYGYKWLNYAPHKVRLALSLYACGLTLREIAELLGCVASTVWNWIVRFGRILYCYVRRKQPKQAFQLHLDELFLRMKKRFYYLFDSIDASTRFAVFTLEKLRERMQAKRLLEQSPKAEYIVSDGLHSYRQALRKMYHYKWLRSHYYRWHKFTDKHNNNLVERLQGTLRRWLHPKRGFHSQKTGQTMLDFYYVYYNYVRKHSTIDMTPAEKAGVIEYKTTNKWKELITKAILLLLPPTINQTKPHSTVSLLIF